MPSPVGHMLAGACIGATWSPDGTRPDYKMIAGGALVGAVPDMDMLLTFAGIDYVDAHRTITHSLVTVGLVTVFLWCVNRLFYIKKDKSHHIPYLFICLCLLSHIGLDLLGEDTYGPRGLMLFWPLSDTFFYPGLTVFKALFSGQGDVLPLISIVLTVTREVVFIGCAGGIWLAIWFWRVKKPLKT